MKKNKGFTLIELLAVLVIIAIIALIITPIVTGVIKDSRIKASENAMTGLLKSIEVYYGKRMMKNDGKLNEYKGILIEFGKAADKTTTTWTLTPATANYTSIDLGALNNELIFDNTKGDIVDGNNTTILEYKGTTVDGGKIIVDRNGVQTTVVPIKINNYYCTNKPNVKCAETAAEVGF